MTKPKQKPLPSEPGDDFIPDAIVCGEFKITKMTLWRWDQNPDLDFPAKIPIEGRNYRSRRMIEDFKQRMIRKAIAERDKRRERRRAQAEAAAS